MVRKGRRSRKECNIIIFWPCFRIKNWRRKKVVTAYEGTCYLD